MAHTTKRPYRKSRRFDKTCRNHGSCPHCRRNRLHNSSRRIVATIFDLVEEEGIDTQTNPGIELDLVSGEITDANDIDSARERHWSHWEKTGDESSI